MATDDITTSAFQELVWNYYHDFGRHDLAWRQPEPDGSFDPYKIMVSELMLQQTQVQRVITKYKEFLALFPDVASLAQAQLGDVLRVWMGLGYNRRAKFLHQSATMVMADFGSVFPTDTAQLVKLPGVGINTAGAIASYAYNQPVVFVETNIRTVIIHHFFNDHTGIADKDILKLVEQTLDHEHPREWYWALMDYGSYLKQTVGNVSRQSKTYAKQSTFAGSKRQIRGHDPSIAKRIAVSVNSAYATMLDMEPTQNPQPAPEALPQAPAPEQPLAPAPAIAAPANDGVQEAPAPSEDEAASKKPEASDKDKEVARPTMPKTPKDNTMTIIIAVTVTVVIILSALAVLAYTSGKK
jgi:A/G-specific adenine glycosylase